MGSSPVAPVLVHESGDSALRVVATGPDAAWSTVHRLADWLDAAGADGVHGVVPTYDSLLVEFDPTLISARQLRAFLQLGVRQLANDATPDRAPREFDVPVVYGGSYGPDLAAVAQIQGLDPEDVINLHCAKTYVIRCLGAPAGSPMMDGPDFPVPVPRLKDPRLSVPAGAVAVAGRQAVIAPATAPGGWQVIGQTPLSLLDLAREPLVPYAPGDIIRFHRVAESAFDMLSGRSLAASR
ncbi:5-oxoprolinase subunit B family protein [Specibacter cremeus]|uniref:5-oxoprolinase subunit B family protein n=1 Tax=Specibacter cremeus TaxID=1629051 RepID=UPI000F78594A|nr:allophanate hydrolase subunit 1 [Specibacter cremeus]